MSNIKKVKIISEFNGKYYKFEIEAFKSISNIKNQIRKITFPLKDIEIMYLNKKFDFNIPISIGELFPNKSSLNFKIIKHDKNDKNYKLKLPLINMKNSYDIHNNSHYEDSSDIKIGGSDYLNRSSDNSEINYFIEESQVKAHLTYLCECAINFVSLFCRNCKSFICKRCRTKVFIIIK